jgi:hypothetical protein
MFDLLDEPAVLGSVAEDLGRVVALPGPAVAFIIQHLSSSN